ncbi:unnamed protein product [Gongylonema pulchrum]|uniref:Uncharacterized protein n=1 Tax=Gongylonema pulchrum TaxID=637853 RepID=A0A183DUR2_9BILA|nr:unnamed protein product [Gongylonema pulchrum]
MGMKWADRRESCEDENFKILLFAINLLQRRKRQQGPTSTAKLAWCCIEFLNLDDASVSPFRPGQSIHNVAYLHPILDFIMFEQITAVRAFVHISLLCPEMNFEVTALVAVATTTATTAKAAAAAAAVAVAVAAATTA